MRIDLQQWTWIGALEEARRTLRWMRFAVMMNQDVEEDEQDWKIDRGVMMLTKDRHAIDQFDDTGAHK